MKIIIDVSLEIIKIICLEKITKTRPQSTNSQLVKFLPWSSDYRTVFAITYGRQLTNSYAGIKCS